MTAKNYNYAVATSRNLGWVTEPQQQMLRAKRIAIAGLGGVGGAHLLTLARLGIGSFNISDLDHFELANFNRQAGATMASRNQPKVEVLEALARDINPTLDINAFPAGIGASNVRRFLTGCDLYIDGIDFFQVEPRRAVFAACAEMGIPAITAAPLGMGAAMLTFLPGSMTFEEYFRLEGQPREEQLIRLMAGLSPRLLQASYLADPTRVDMANRKVPSTGLACDLCAGMVAAEALKILLDRGHVKAAPHGVQYDAYRQKLVRTWRPWGNRNPIQRILIALIRRKLGKRLIDSPDPAAPAPAETGPAAG